MAYIQVMNFVVVSARYDPRWMFLRLRSTPRFLLDHMQSCDGEREDAYTNSEGYIWRGCF